jgi:hypothetical protein
MKVAELKREGLLSSISSGNLMTNSPGKNSRKRSTWGSLTSLLSIRMKSIIVERFRISWKKCHTFRFTVQPNAVKSLVGQYHHPEWNYQVVKTGDSLDIGNGKE